MENEDIDPNAGMTGTATAEPSSSYGEILNGEKTTPEDSQKAPEASTSTSPEANKNQTPPDEEVTIEIAGKTFTGKQSELAEVLENHQKFFQKLQEKEKNLERHWNEKYQSGAAIGKSLESAFGRMPKTEEIQSLGKLWNAYFQDEKSRQVIDAILSGTLDQTAGSPAQPDPKSQNPETSALKQEIASLKSQLEQFTNSFQEKEQLKAQSEADRSWKTWVKSKADQKIQVTEDIERQMAPFIKAFIESHPEWEDAQILDRAYEHATMGQNSQKIVNDVLTNADQLKKGNPPKITPKSVRKSDGEKTYADIIREVNA